MTKTPLAIPDDTSNIISSTALSANPPDAWISLIFAAFFLIVAFYQTFLCLKYRAFVAWTITLAAILECFSHVEYAYHAAYPVSPGWLVSGAMVHWLAPSVLVFFCIQVFGRAAWAAAAVPSNRRYMLHLIGFIRWNTVIFGCLSFAAWFVLCVGSAVVVGVAPNGEANQSNITAVNAGQGTLKAGLILQLIIVLACALIVWRFKVTTTTWEVEWDEKRRFVWTWKKLVTLVLISFGLLFVRQTYHLVRFFLKYTQLPWLGLIFDSVPMFSILVMFTVFHPGQCLSIELAGFRRRKDDRPSIFESKRSSQESLVSG